MAEAEVEVAGGLFAQRDGLFEELNGDGEIAEVEAAESAEVSSALDARAAVLGFAEELEGGLVVTAADGRAGALMEEADLLREHDLVEEVPEAVGDAIKEAHDGTRGERKEKKDARRCADFTIIRMSLAPARQRRLHESGKSG